MLELIVAYNWVGQKFWILFGCYLFIASFKKTIKFDFSTFKPRDQILKLMGAHCEKAKHFQKTKIILKSKVLFTPHQAPNPRP